MKDAVERLRVKSQNERTVFALSELLRDRDKTIESQAKRIAELEAQLSKPIRNSLIVADSDAQPSIEITDDMALSFHRALTDGAIGASEVEEIKIGLRAAFANVAQPAPKE